MFIFKEDSPPKASELAKVKEPLPGQGFMLLKHAVLEEKSLA